MIVTRRRARRSSGARFILPLVAIAAIGFALSYAPSQRAIANGPLKPVWTALALTGTTVARPLTFAAEQEKINDRDRTIRSLNGELEKQRREKTDADARAQAAQAQYAALANQPRPTPAPAVRPTPAPAAFGAPAAGGTSVAAATAARPATAEEKRLAATWAAMDAERAAAVAQRLPDGQVTRVLAAMDSDSAGAIMNALPAAAAARISRAVAQAEPASNR